MVYRISNPCEFYDGCERRKELSIEIQELCYHGETNDERLRTPLSELEGKEICPWYHAQKISKEVIEGLRKDSKEHPNSLEVKTMSRQEEVQKIVKFVEDSAYKGGFKFPA